MDPTKLMTPFGVDIDLVEGGMQDPDRHLVRTASDMRGHYRDEAALEKLIDAGHNYGDIETEGFPKRVFLRDGKVVIE